MRLTKLEIEGITSIKSKTIIDFENDLEGEDLFAITGPTGSGKSTILNCISLALFDDTYKSLARDEYVSLNADRGRILLEFEMNGNIYQCLWECVLVGVRGTRIKKPKTIKEFYKNGNPLDTKLISPSSVIGLDMEQFHKTVIINQGQFSEFISAPFAKRKLILEKIYSTENISAFPGYLKQVIKNLNDEVHLLETKMEGGLPFKEEDYTQHKANIEKNRIQQSEIKNDYEYLEKYTSCLKDMNTNATQINQNKKSIFDLNNKLKISESELDKNQKELKLHSTKLSQHLEKINLESPLIEKAIILSDRLNKLNDDRNINLKKKEELQEIKEKEERVKEESLSELNNLNNKLLADYKSIVFDYNTNFKRLEELYNQCNTTTQFLKIHQKSLDGIKSEMTTAEKQGHQIKDNIESIKKLITLESTDTTVEKDNKLLDLITSNIEAEKESLKSSEKLFRDLNDSKTKIIEFNECIDTNNQSVKKFKKQIETNNNNIESLSNKLSLSEKTSILLEKEKYLNELSHSIQLCFKEAHKNKECPVCSNKEIPESSKVNIESFNIEDNQKEIEKAKKDIDETKMLISNLKRDNDHLNSQISKSNDDIDKSITLIKKQTEFFNLADHENHVQSIDDLMLKESLKSSKHNDKITVLETEISKLSIQLNNLKHQRDKYKKLSIKLNEEDVLLKDHNTKLTLLTSELSNLLKIKSETVLDEASKHINQIKEKNEIDRDIENKKRLLVTQERSLNNLFEQTKSTLQTINKNSEDIIKFKSEINEIENKLNTKNFEKLRSENEKITKEFQNKKDAYTKKSLDIQGRRDFLSGQISIKKENNSLLENLVLKHLTTLRNRDFRAHNTEIKDIDDKINKISKHESGVFEEWETENITGFIDDKLEFFLTSYKTKFEEISADIIRSETLIQSYDEKVIEFKKLPKAINHYQEQLLLKEKLREVIGRDEFTRFSISMIEQQLIQMANHELQQLCDGRYELFQQEKNKTNGPEFYIKDNWRCGSERPLQTLSGGETFMVSLAMALGLAEMSRGHTEIDTFFIDEGFGTLDQDSLEEVLNILMSIRSRGKQIGIISHVKELTDRLPIRIQLQKDQMGESHLEFSSH